ncbi:MAG: tetratricopeptide repeat protein [Acidobacteriia bacterium]|nr:tetratricopeptide repeat protein [Terriglobia bacterium]
MRFRVFLRTVALSLTVSILVPFAPAQHGGQTGRGTTNNNGSNNTGNGSGRIGSDKNPDSQSQFQREPLLFISGSVVLDDGSPPPMGVVIERDCGGRTTREAHVSPNGSFGFQVGVDNRVLPDASESGPGTPWDPVASPSGPFSSSGWTPASWLAGCELRARLGGYRSSHVLLAVNQTMGMLDVGTIVLYPAERVPGTTISATNLAAPKEAKKALEKAEKAFQKKNFDETEKDVEAALKVYPGYATAWYELGRVYEQSHRVEEARTAFSKALAADKNYVNPIIELAQLAATEAKWQETADLTERALELDPVDFPEGYYLNSLANYTLSRLDAAEGSARKLERLDTLHRFPEAFLIMAGVFNQRKDSAGEADQLRNYLQYAPQSAIADKVRSRLKDLEKTAGVQQTTRKVPAQTR